MHVNKELDWVCLKVKNQIQRFGSDFPSACTTEGKFRIKGNDDWTNGFWVGMLWICYEYSNEQIFLDTANTLCDDFKSRIDDRHVMDHHDIGFLISPSLVARYKLFGDEDDKLYALKAADMLLERYQKKGQFIQAWGNLGDPEEYRFIVDSMINIPLLFWAYEMTGEERYQTVAQNHFNTVVKYGIRDDYTSHHTFFFDVDSGDAIGGKTAQGLNDNSCWARGQAWVGLGLTLNNKYLQKPENLELFEQVYSKYCQMLPADKIPYWDLVFTDDCNQYHDSSSAAIMINGLLEYPGNKYDDDIETVVTNLIDGYTTKYDTTLEGILKHGVYAFGIHKGVDEANLWGDYFYVEALYRLHCDKKWQGYW